MSFDPVLVEAGRSLRQGRPIEAARVLQAEVAGATTMGRAHALLLEALLAAGDRRAALDVLDQTVALSIETADGYDAIAFFARALDRHELSNACYRRAVELSPKDAQLWYNLATSERSLGRLGASADACDRVLRLDSAYRPAVLLRSEVMRADPTQNHVDDLRQRLAKSEEDRASPFLWYALGKELHELGDTAEAFAAFARGAFARRQSLQYDVSHDEQKLRRIAAVFHTGGALPPNSRPGRHIFIIGLPRTGTTLLERILGGLENVRSNNETNNFSTALMMGSSAKGHDVFERAALADDRVVAAEYNALASSGNGASHIIEKLPFNYLYVASILRAFPTASILWMRRHPVDTCFAMFRTLFGAAYPFSYDFQELARYFAAYETLMRHWTTLFPDRVMPINYEELVAAPKAVGRRAAQACGLVWRDSAVEISMNYTASLTASAAQVRGEIYTTSAGAWAAYNRELGPLVQHLYAAGVDIGPAE